MIHMNVSCQVAIPIVKDTFLTEVVIRDVRNWFFQKPPLKMINLCLRWLVSDCCLVHLITSIGDLPLIITISDTCKNQTKRLDSDNTINLSSLIVSLDSFIGFVFNSRVNDS